MSCCQIEHFEHDPGRRLWHITSDDVLNACLPRRCETISIGSLREGAVSTGCASWEQPFLVRVGTDEGRVSEYATQPWMITASGGLDLLLDKTKPSIRWEVVKRFTEPDCEIVVHFLLSLHFWAVSCIGWFLAALFFPGIGFTAAFRTEAFIRAIRKGALTFGASSEFAGNRHFLVLSLGDHPLKPRFAR